MGTGRCKHQIAGTGLNAPHDRIAPPLANVALFLYADVRIVVTGQASWPHERDGPDQWPQRGVCERREGALRRGTARRSSGRDGTRVDQLVRESLEFLVIRLYLLLGGPFEFRQLRDVIERDRAG